MNNDMITHNDSMGSTLLRSYLEHFNAPQPVERPPLPPRPLQAGESSSSSDGIIDAGCIPVAAGAACAVLMAGVIAWLGMLAGAAYNEVGRPGAGWEDEPIPGESVPAPEDGARSGQSPSRTFIKPVRNNLADSK